MRCCGILVSFHTCERFELQKCFIFGLYQTSVGPQRTSFLVCCMNRLHLGNDAIVILITYFYQVALAMGDSKATFWSSSQVASCLPLSTVEAFTDSLIAEQRQAESL